MSKLEKLSKVLLAFVLVVGVMPSAALADTGSAQGDGGAVVENGDASGEEEVVDPIEDTDELDTPDQQEAAPDDTAADPNAAELESSEVTENSDIAIEPDTGRYIEDGTYTLSSAIDPFKVLDIAHGSTSGGALLQIYESNKTVAQQFSFVYDETNGLYTITNVKSGKVLEAAGAEAKNGVAVEQSEPDGSQSQLWAIGKSDDGTISIHSALNQHWVMDVKGGSSDNYTAIQLHDINETAAQSFYPIGTPASVVGGKTIEDGYYTIASSGNSSKVLDVASGSTESGANIRLWNSNESAAQRFKFECDDEGFYTITNMKSGKVLDAASANLVPSTNVRQWNSNGTDAQKWAVRANDDGSYSIVNKNSGLMLDAASSAKGENVQLWASDSSRVQSFSIQSAVMERTVDDGTYFVSSAKRRSLVFDVTGGSRDKGAAIQAYTSNMTDAQRFVFEYDETTGFYTITNVKSGKVLDATGGSVSKGTKIQQWTANGTLAQAWEVVADGDTLMIRSPLDPSMVFDLARGSTSSGTAIRLWSSNDTVAQRFCLSSDTYFDVPGGEDLGLDGWYEIVPTTSDATCFDIASGSRSSGAAVRLWNDNQTMAQLFKLEYSDGYYRIVSANSDLALELMNGSVVPGVEAFQTNVTESASQKFRVDQNEDGSYTFTCVANNLRLGVVSTDSGTAITGEKANDASSCKTFNLVKRTHVLQSKLVAISSVLNTYMYFDVADGSRSSGANIQLWKGNGTLAQKWQVVQVEGETDVYRFESVCSGMYMAIDGSNVCQLAYDAESAGQKWRLVSIDAGACTFENVESGKVLDLNGGSASNGANIQTYASNGSDAQKFYVKDTDNIKTGMYVFHSMANYDQVLDVCDGSDSDGANIQSYSPNDTGAQKWSIVANGDGSYRIVNAANEKVFDVQNGNAYDGANIQQYSWNESSAQKWYVTYQGGGGMSFESALDRSLVLSLASDSPGNGTNLQLAAKDGSAAQRFAFEPTTYVPPIPAEMQEMIDRMYWQSSGTEWAIGIDRSAHKVGIFNGSYHNWTLYYWWDCTNGALSMPTPTGEYWTTGFKKSNLNSDPRAIYCTQIFGAYYIHSVLMGTWELGRYESHGCIRLDWDNAWWVYCNIWGGTKVFIYN